MDTICEHCLRKDKNWDGQVDIKDKLIEAEQKAKS
jgi:hypothetical protein